jgi:ATP phosphoribosyltransferase
MSTVTLALSKGRILEDALPLLARAGLAPVEDFGASRKLIVDSREVGLKLVMIRAQDVPTYVQFGAADLGFAGRDVLMEHGGDGLEEVCDLKIARCRMMVAEPKELADRDDPRRWRRLRIATKYPNITRAHFAAKGVQTEIIKLYGSMELAPLSGLSDRIVDLVDTGGTLKANGLVEVEQIADISARLIVNRASLRVKTARLKELIARIERAAA